MNTPTIGLLTFHAAHNYGSVLQAYATQTMLDSLGLANEIVNYRLPNQLAYYNVFYTPRFGTKRMLKRLACLPEFRLRSQRKRLFEAFIHENLRLSARCFHSFMQLVKEGARYPILLVGSDQVWNRHCAAEFATEPPESILAYLLAFGEPNAKRIAFSSSIGSMKFEELMEFSAHLNNFDSISMRESSAAEIVSKIVSRPIATTLDPTLMLDRKAWLALAKPTSLATRGYVLLYSLKHFPNLHPLLRSVRSYAAKQNLDVVSIAPFSPVFSPGVVNAISAGPREFLSLIANARAVVTDSFHGTAFSVNFGTPFFVIDSSRDQRKQLLLAELGLGDRILQSPEDLLNASAFELDFQAAWTVLKAKRLSSWSYLCQAFAISQNSTPLPPKKSRILSGLEAL